MMKYASTAKIHNTHAKINTSDKVESPVSEPDIFDRVEIKLLKIVDSVESCCVVVVTAGPTCDGVPRVVDGAWVVAATAVVEVGATVETAVEEPAGVVGGCTVTPLVVVVRLGRVVVVVDAGATVVATVAGAVVDTVVTGGSVVGIVVTHSTRLPSGRKQ